MEDFEAFDPELKELMGDHYSDRSVREAEEETPEATREPVAQDKLTAMLDKMDRIEAAAKWRRLLSVAKWTLAFGALSGLIVYWQQTGLMAPAAAVPSLYTCALLIGWGVGKYGRR